MGREVQVAPQVEAAMERLAVARHDMPEVLLRCDPDAVVAALEKTGGDPHRLTAEPDGSVIVWNGPVW